jgi:hypothetical protein
LTTDTDQELPAFRKETEENSTELGGVSSFASGLCIANVFGVPSSIFSGDFTSESKNSAYRKKSDHRFVIITCHQHIISIVKYHT